jgi:SEC-C motif-containing protein
MTSPLAGACPCGSGRPYGACCGPHHDGEPAPTAEALMRSRYAAYATGRTDYVFRTWHPRTRPDDLAPDPDLAWLGLEVLGTSGGGPDDETGTVEFRARYRAPDGEHVLHEVSRFARRAGRWVYVDGDVT